VTQPQNRFIFAVFSPFARTQPANKLHTQHTFRESTKNHFPIIIFFVCCCSNRRFVCLKRLLIDFCFHPKYWKTQTLTTFKQQQTLLLFLMEINHTQKLNLLLLNIPLLYPFKAFFFTPKNKKILIKLFLPLRRQQQKRTQEINITQSLP
jgi:hypothetical protein